ncbi:hypothetical protein [Bacteroides fluxus]|uniref:hypothetical protein n=1 Tax=Bacteroides fluxus TaxID=626930 RepID=UPI002355DD1C|nr:hypothetical protein [Bacteroides fluxus]
MKEIGGYLELELEDRGDFLHSDGICLNSGRNALEYILISCSGISKIWIPYFTCEVILEPIRKLNIPYSFYPINERLEIEGLLQLGESEYLLYTNYYGIKDQYISYLSKLYGQKLIVDNAQALYAVRMENIKTFYSPRKFVGIPDGGIAYTNNMVEIPNYAQDVSYDRCMHLLKRLEMEAIEGYNDFRINSGKLIGQPISVMSLLSRKILSSIDFLAIRKKRIQNFEKLHEALMNRNLLDMSDFGFFECPMIYPYYVDDKTLRKKLIDNRIYVATYWPNVLKWCSEDKLEYELTNNIIALPIDQRYGSEEMDYIIKFLV